MIAMKQRILIAALLAFILGHAASWADEVSNYKWNLSGLSNGTLDRKFAPAGWGHIDDYWYGEPEYTKSAQTITCTDQGEGDYGHMDLLVSPLVKGQVTIKAKDNSSYETGTVTFYACTKSGSTFKAGCELQPLTAFGHSQDDYETLTLSLDDYTYVGIRISNCTVRDFTAEMADVVVKKELTISSVTSKNAATVDVTPEGTFTLSYGVKVKNSGDVDLSEADANFSISLLVGDESVVVATEPIPAALPAGETSDEIAISATLNAADYPSPVAVAIRENFTENISRQTTVSVTPYAPMLSVSLDGKELAADDVVSFGNTKTAVERTLTLANNGGKDAHITSVTTSGSFSLKGDAPQTVPAHASATLTVEMGIAAVGEQSGTLTIAGEEGINLTVALAGNVIDSDTYFEDFEASDKIPADMINEGDWSIGKGSNGSNSAYVYWTSDKKLVTPKLRVKDGAQLTVDVARYSSYTPKLVISYSADRINWTEAKTVADSEFPAREGDYWTGYTYPYSTVVVNTIPAGDYFIGFQADYARIDNICGFELAPLGHDVMLMNAKVPATGSVNDKLTATVDVRNYGVMEPAGEYAVELLIDNEVVAQADAADLDKDATLSYTMEFTPHVAGTFEAKIRFTSDGYEVESAATELVIGAESASELVQVGTPGSESNSVAPMCLTEKYSASSTLYPANRLGISNGTKISGMKYKGISRYEVDLNTLSVWVEEVDGTDMPSSLSELTANATKVYGEAAYSFVDHNRYENVDEIVINFAEPIVYQGGNLRVTMQTYYRYAGYDTPTFEAERGLGTTIYDFDDYDEVTSLGKSADFSPVVYLLTEKDAKHLSGVVTDGTDGVEGAEVTLTSGDVIYTTLTAADGSFSLDVLKDGLVYDLRVSKDGYADYEESGLELTEDITGKQIVLQATTGIKMGTVGETVSGAYYDLSGRRMADRPSARGVYVRDGRKIVIK